MNQVDSAPLTFAPSFTGSGPYVGSGFQMPQSGNISPLARLSNVQGSSTAVPVSTLENPGALQMRGELGGAQSFLQSYCQGPPENAGSEDVSEEAVGYGHYIGLHVDDQLAQAQQSLASGQISQSQFDQISQIDQGVEQTVLSDDAANNGRKLTQANFADIHSQMNEAAALLAGGQSTAV